MCKTGLLVELVCKINHFAHPTPAVKDCKICLINWGNKMSDLIKWLFFGSIYGAMGIAIALYFLLKHIRSSGDKDNVPLLSATAVVLIGIFILPSIPMYNFESDVLANIAGKPWVKIVNKSKVGSLTEPLTWFTSSVGSITLVSPGDALNPGFHV